MRLVCHLREIRGRRSIREISEAAGLNRGMLSSIERGRALPTDKWLEPLERAYGAPRTQWWPPEVLLVLEYDNELAA